MQYMKLNNEQLKVLERRLEMPLYNYDFNTICYLRLEEEIMHNFPIEYFYTLEKNELEERITILTEDLMFQDPDDINTKFNNIHLNPEYKITLDKIKSALRNTKLELLLK